MKKTPSLFWLANFTAIAFAVAVIGCGPAEVTTDSDTDNLTTVSETIEEVEITEEAAPAPETETSPDAEAAPEPETDSSAVEAPAKEFFVVAADEWGDLTGQFIFNGDAPKAAAVDVKGDAFCTTAAVKTEDLVVDGTSKGIRDVIIFLYVGRGDDDPAVHPDYEELVKKPVTLDNVKCRFEPRVAVMQTGQKLVLKNSDPIGHNMKGAPFANEEFNVNLPAGASFEKDDLTEAERAPMKVDCSIHGWMSSYVMINDHPYAAVTDKDGNFTIKNLPVGKYKFRAWQQKAGYISESQIDGDDASWTRGYEIEIKAGENDLGKVVVPASAFEE